MSTAGTVNHNQRSMEIRSRILWVGMIVGLLSLQILCCLIGVLAATGTPSLAVIPNYHQQAMHWDEAKAAVAASAALNWQTRIEVSEAIDIYGNRPGQVRLSREDASPVEISGLRLRMFHHTRVQDVIGYVCKPNRPGCIPGGGHASGGPLGYSAAIREHNGHYLHTEILQIPATR
ncbi:MAG: FixH family protein [Planctomycetaceae bacterium]